MKCFIELCISYCCVTTHPVTQWLKTMNVFCFVFYLTLFLQVRNWRTTLLLVLIQGFSFSFTVDILLYFYIFNIECRSLLVGFLMTQTLTRMFSRSLLRFPSIYQPGLHHRKAGLRLMDLLSRWPIYVAGELMLAVGRWPRFLTIWTFPWEYLSVLLTWQLVSSRASNPSRARQNLQCLI